VVLSAGYGGPGPGLVATALSGLPISYYWLPPRYSFAVSDLNDLLGLVIFLAVGLLISAINERQLRHATAVLAALRKSEQLLSSPLPAQSGRDVPESSRRADRRVQRRVRPPPRLLVTRRGLSHNLRDFYANPQARDELMARLRPGGVTTNQELQWRRHDGTPLSTLLNVRQDEDGVLEGLVIEMPGRGPSGRRV